MTHEQFCSSNATAKEDIKHFLEELVEDGISKLTKQIQVDELKFAKDLEVNAAYIARAIQSSDAIEDAVVVDFSAGLDFLSKAENLDSTIAMFEDVSNWDEINFPFDSILMKITPHFFLHIFKVMGDEEDGTYYYNFNAFTPHLEKNIPWFMTEVCFQIKYNDPMAVAFDTAYEALDGERLEAVDNLARAHVIACFVFLYLEKHKKVQTRVAEIPTTRNTKRIKRGRTPYSEYRVVELGDYTHRTKSYLEGTKGTHASPKMHMRCGHWRRKPYRQDKIWIHSTVVGNPAYGVVIKEYKKDSHGVGKPK